VSAQPAEYPFPSVSYAELYQVVHQVVRAARVPFHNQADAVSEILVRLLENDSFTNFRPQAPDHQRLQFIGYVRRYASLTCRRLAIDAYVKTKELTDFETSLMDLIAKEDPDPEEVFDDDDSVERFQALTESEDARVVIQLADQFTSYRHELRVALVELGWDSNRIRRAVREVRTALRNAGVAR
jgi:hypothetical protein